MSIPIDFIVRQGLQVATNVVVGTYALNVANPPTNGLIVSGNVGIGTASPVQQLQVVGNIQITNAAGALSGIYFADGTYQATSASSYSTPAGGPVNSVQYNTGSGFGGSNNFVFNSNAVGIGTSTPAHILDVQSSTSVASFATRSGTDYQINIGNNTPSGNVAVLGYSNSNLYAYITTGLQPIPTLVVTQGNRVGIATTVPVNTLDVNGSVAIGTYAGVSQAPTNGLAVSGSIGVGVNSTSAKIGILADTSQTAIAIQSSATAGNFLQFTNSSSSTVFTVNSLGNVTTGGYQGNVIAANYGGTGQTSYVTGDLLYAGSGGAISALTRLPIGNSGNILVVSGGVPTWGNVSINDFSGILPISSGGTNAAAFVGSSFVVTAANAAVMTSVTSTTNAAVVFNNSGVPSIVSGGPYTYLTPNAGGGALSFSKVDLANGVTNTLSAGNGGTGQNTVSQYQLLVGGATNSWNLLSSSVTSALVTSVTGSPQWVTGTTGNTVLRSNGTSVTFSQVNLPTDVTGVLPYANGGTNSAVSFTQGSVIFAGSTGFNQNNSNLYWDNSQNHLGINTSTPTTALDVNGAVTIRNGGNIVTGGLYVGGGTGNFASSLVANGITSNTFVNAASVYSSGAISAVGAVTAASVTSNTTVSVLGTTTSTGYTSGAVTVAGGVGIAGNLNVQGTSQFLSDLSVVGNLTVGGNIVAVNTDLLNVENPTIGLGTGVEGNALVINDGYDRGLVINYFDSTQNLNDYAFLGRQNATGDLIYITNVQPGSKNISNVVNPFTSNSLGFQWGSAYLGNITLLGNIASTTTTTGSLVLTGPGGLGVGGSINAGGALNVGTYAYAASGFNTAGPLIASIIASNGFIVGSSLNASGLIIGNVVTANSLISTANLTASGNIVASNFFANSTITASNAVISGNLVANGIVSNTFVNTITLNTTGRVTVANANAAISTTTGALVVKGGVGVGGTVVAGGLILNSSNIALGSSAGVGQGGSSIAIGLSAGGTNQGHNSVAVGPAAGGSTQGNYTVAIGSGAGGENQSIGAVAVGFLAGVCYQSKCAVAVGITAGSAYQGNSAVAVGNGAGSNYQGNSAVAIGTSAGVLFQSASAVAVGLNAGATSQGNNAVAIGAFAGTLNQPGNSIIINAGVTALNGTNSGLYISPVRCDATNTAQTLYYNTSTKEVTYSAPTAGYGNANVASYLSGPVVIGNLYISNSTTTTSAITGALVTPGGIASGNNIWVTNSGWIGNLSILNTTNSTSFQTGALVVNGGVGINGNLYVNGNIVGSNVAVITGNSGVFYGNGFGFNAIYAGVSTGYAVLPSTVFQTDANINNYAQNNFQNINNGNQASTDWVATSSDGSDTTNYIDFGITSGTWDGTQSNSLGTALKSNDGYLYVQGGTGGGNLVIGTSSAGSALKINVGGSGAAYVSAVFNNAGNTTTSATTGALVLTGGLAASGNAYVAGSGWFGNISVTNTTASTSSTTGALVVAGGVGIGGAASITGSVSAGSVYSTTNISAVGSATASAVVSNTSVTGNSFVLNGNLATISTTGTVTVDTFPTSAYRTVHYLAQITDNTNVGQYHSEQLFILQDGTTAYQTDFNLVFSVRPLGAFSSSISAGTFSLFFTPYAATNKNIRVVRTGVSV
jgi:hypothetical protein